MSRIIKVWVPDERYHQLKDLSSVYRVSLSAIAGSMIEERLAGKEGFEEKVAGSFEDLSKRLGKMAHKLFRTEALIEEFLSVYLFYTPEVPKDFPGRAAMFQSRKFRLNTIRNRVAERVKKGGEVTAQVEASPGSGGEEGAGERDPDEVVE